jgi:hypothetical protein
MTETKLDGIMRKLQALIERADHPNTPEHEADACRQKADALMLKYKIESVLAGGGKANGTTPEWGSMAVGYSGSEFANYHRHIASEVLQHVGGRGVMKSEWEDAQVGYRRWLDVVAFPSDLRYAEILLLSCLNEFGKRLEPKYDPNLTDAENVHAMRAAGMERGRIGAVIWGKKYETNAFKAQNRKVTKLFKEECERRGEDASIMLGKGNNMAAFRVAYAEGFTQTIGTRLWRMRSNRGAEASGLVLADLSERVNEAFYEKYPEHRPAEPKVGEQYKAPNDGCAKCEKAKGGYCRDHMYLKPRDFKAKTLRADAFHRGAAAARAVDLGREGTPKAPAANRGEIA